MERLLIWGGGKSGRDPGCPGSCHRGRGSGAEQIEDEDGT